MDAELEDVRAEDDRAEDDPIHPLPWIAAEDFEEFAEMLAEDDSFPFSHSEWELLAEAQQAELVAEGHTAKLVDVRPAGFRQFLTESGGDASLNSLAAYVALLATAGR